MGEAKIPLEKLDFISNETFAVEGYPHEAWARLRREAPVFFVEPRGPMEGFWAITKHADIVQISKDAKINRIGPRLAVFPETPPPEADTRPHHLLTMDPPEHARYRRLAAGYFTPRAVRRLEPEVRRITRDLLDGLRRDGELSEMDFVESVTAPLTLSVLADMLGVPRPHWELMFRWTNQIAGADDPEYRPQGATPAETATAARTQLFDYFAKLAEERRGKETSDLVTVLTNAKLDGKPLPTLELLSYFFLLVIAGNETTRNAASGGLLALIESPDEWAKIRSDPPVLDSAVEEIVRWTSPVIQFCRTPTRDYEIRGRRIPAGEAMCLFYPSANRDEEVFDDPFRFRVDREPNPHLAFGVGEHYCLGAHLARLELRVLFEELARRMEHVELAGPMERMRSSFLGGVKHMPIRYRMRPDA